MSKHNAAIMGIRGELRKSLNGLGIACAFALGQNREAADEAECQAWLFRNAGEAMAWTGNGPLSSIHAGRKE